MKNRTLVGIIFVAGFMFSHFAEALPLYFSCSLFSVNGSSTPANPLPESAVLVPDTTFTERVISDKTVLTFNHHNLAGDSMKFQATLEKPLNQYGLIVAVKNLSHFGYSQTTIPLMPVDGTPFYQGYNGVDQPIANVSEADFVLRCLVN